MSNFFARVSETQVLHEIGRVEHALASGNLSPRLNENLGNGPTNAVLAAINSLLNSATKPVEELSTQIANMAAEHDRGDIDVVIDSAELPGRYGIMAKQVNDLVGAHIRVKKQAMACIKAFGEGDFKAPMEQLPGKKAFINNTIETLRRNLTGLIAEMRHMSTEHDRGYIDVVIDDAKFQGDFGVVARGINEMVAGHIAVKKKAMACVKAFGEGNFDAPLEQFPGQKAFIDETIETLRKNLREITAEIQHLIVAATDGKLAERSVASRFVGDFCQAGFRHQRHARRYHLAYQRRQSRAGPAQYRQFAGNGRDRMPWRPSAHEGRHQHVGYQPAQDRGCGGLHCGR